jgi:hypothetical protein
MSRSQLAAPFRKRRRMRLGQRSGGLIASSRGRCSGPGSCLFRSATRGSSYRRERRARSTSRAGRSGAGRSPRHGSCGRRACRASPAAAPARGRAHDHKAAHLSDEPAGGMATRHTSWAWRQALIPAAASNPSAPPSGRPLVSSGLRQAGRAGSSRGAMRHLFVPLLSAPSPNETRAGCGHFIQHFEDSVLGVLLSVPPRSEAG